MLQFLAHRMKEQEFGGLSDPSHCRLRELANAVEVRLSRRGLDDASRRKQHTLKAGDTVMLHASVHAVREIAGGRTEHLLRSSRNKPKHLKCVAIGWIVGDTETIHKRRSRTCPE